MGLASVLAAQPCSAQKPDDPSRNAMRLVRLIEIPDRAADAIDELLKLRAAAVEPLITTARHPDPKVATAAMRCLAALGTLSKPALPALREIAESKEKTAGAAAWAIVRIDRKGGLLVGHMGGSEIVELDEVGRVAGRVKAGGQVWGIERLASGNYLVAEVNGKVREIPPKGDTVWQFTDVKSPYDAERLPNGNTLIADFRRKRVIEVTPDKEIVWEVKDIAALEADRLANGHTLITDYTGKRILEVDSSGEIVWKLEKIKHAYEADRLLDGTTLVAFSSDNVARIYDRDGEVVREIGDLPNVSDVDMLASGLMVVAGKDSVRLIGVDGKDLWRTRLSGWIGSVFPR